MNMKKITLALAGVVATVAFAPEASALPVFARQVGMACSACHFQHFPLLNAFGRAFKASGFTMGGAQANIEGEGLSIPATLNASFLTSMGYEKTNAVKTPGTITNTSSGGASTGAFYVGATGGEASLFLGGRGSDFMGYLTEVTLGGGAGAVDSLKTPILFDFDGTRAGVVFFSTNGQGVSYGFETLNTGANAVHSISNTVGLNGQYIAAISAQQYLGTNQGATGAALVAVNNMGFINITKFDQVGPGTAALASLSSTYIRVAGTFDLAGWDSAVGVQSWSGSSVNPTGTAGAAAVAGIGGTLNPNGSFTCTATPCTSPVAAGVATPGVVQTKAWAVDGQMQGSLGDKPVGVYVTYAKAPYDANEPNAFNSGTADKSSFNIAGEIGVIPEKATIGAAVRMAKSGVAAGGSNNASDNAIYLTGTYKLAQNLLGRLSYVHQSGDYWSSSTGNSDAVGSNSYTLNLYALF